MNGIEVRKVWDKKKLYTGSKMELYLATKYEAHEYSGEHGFTMCGLWKVVTGKNGDDCESVDRTTFWKNTVLADYRNDHDPYEHERRMRSGAYHVSNSEFKSKERHVCKIKKSIQYFTRHWTQAGAIDQIKKLVDEENAFKALGLTGYRG